MSQYKIYSYHGNGRAIMVRIAAEYAKIDYEFINTTIPETKEKQFTDKHALAKVPFLECPEGTLFETPAIMKYFARKSDPALGLLGNGALEEAQVNQWIDFSTDLMSLIPQIFLTYWGYTELNEELYKAQRKMALDRLQIVNNHLNENSFLVGDHFTVADAYFGQILFLLSNTILDDGYRKGHASIGRYYRLIINGQPIIKKYYRRAFSIKKEAIVVKADAKKVEKPAAKKTEAKKEKKEEVVVDVIPKKAKNPLECLPESKFVLFDFKTFIVNEKDTKKAVAEFWKQFDSEGYSIWHTKYDRYEGEGDKLFMTSNMMGSFLQRLDNFRKYVFGNYGVYGKEGDYEIMGVWVWRGTEIPQEIKELPSYEYNTWTRLDHTKEEDRQRLEAHWVNRVNDESVVEGLTARDVCWFK